MLRIRRDEGATTAEYVAVLLLVAALVAALLTSGLATGVVDGVRRALCQLLTGGPCPGAGTAATEPLNRMGLPCLTRRDASEMGFSLVADGYQMDRGAGSTVEQLGTGTYRVTLYGEDAIGAGTLFGDGPGSLGRQKSGKFGWITGNYGDASATVGGRTSVSYDFATREAAEAFARSQRGGVKRWLHTAGGAQGHVITQSYEWLKRRITREEEPEPTLTSVQLQARGRGRFGANGGWVGGRANASATGSGVLTFINRNRWRAFTASVDGSAGAGPSALMLSVDGSVGGAARYRVIFDEHQQPMRLSVIVERGSTLKVSRDNAAVWQGRSKGEFGAGMGHGQGRSASRVVVEEVNLDLRDPANRAAFDRAFDVVPGVAAWPRVPVPGGPPGVNALLMRDEQQALAARARADGVKVRLEYDETAPSQAGGAVAVGKGLLGFNGMKEDIHRDLVSATIQDARWKEPAPRRFADCWTDSGGAGVPSGAGAPGDGPGQ